MRVLVTRPAAQSAAWVARLQAAGIDAAALPLIEIAPVPDRALLVAAWQALAERNLVVFVSPNAVLQFFATRPRSAVWPPHLAVAAPGPGTARMLVELGVPKAQVIEPAAAAPQFDSEALWAQLDARDWRGACVLLVRGEAGRDWLADRLRARGAQVDALAAYRRAAPALDADQQALLGAAIAAPHRHLWLFSSSLALDHLAQLGPVLGAARAQLCPALDAKPAQLRSTLNAAPWSAARALATHPRIAARAQQLGFGAVVEARPTWEAVVGCIQSLRP